MSCPVWMRIYFGGSPNSPDWNFSIGIHGRSSNIPKRPIEVGEESVMGAAVNFILLGFYYTPPLECTIKNDFHTANFSHKYTKHNLSVQEDHLRKVNSGPQREAF